MAVATVARRRTGFLPRTRTGRTRLFGYILLTPAMLYIVALVGVPFLLAIYYSMSDVTTSNLEGGFVGLRTFVDLVQDPAFRQALGNTIVYTVFSIVLNTILGTFLGFLLMSDFVGKRVIRFLILLPWTIPIALSSITWKWMFDTQYSIVNWIGNRLGVLASNPNWLGDPILAVISIIAVNVWRGFPFAAIILLAGMTSISPEVLDAAKVDGAGPVTRFRKVIVPMIAPILFVGSLYDLVFTLTDMTIVYLLTLGGPNNSTHVLASYAFLVGIQSGALGRGAAIAILLFPILLVIIFVVLRSLRRRDI